MACADDGLRVHAVRFARYFERRMARHRLLVWVDFLVVAGGMMMVLFPHYYLAVKWIGLAFMLVAVLWSSAFRQRLVD